MRRREFLKAGVSAWTVACSARTTLDTDSSEALPVSQWDEPIELDESLFPQSIASGDPKPSSVVLWTRAPNSSVVYLQLALDKAFTQLVSLHFEGRPVAEVPILLSARHDHCARIKVDTLSPGTVYYYRFVSEGAAGVRSSRTGRTKTAPPPDADVEPRFVVLSCQDYSGHYHALRRAAELEPDFVVHLGDYIYETSDDPSFQAASNDRRIVFRDPDGALPRTVSAGGATPQRVLAARSLDNYRQLYATYRTDPWLQRLHETAPMIAVGDDHEFANDSTSDRTPERSARDSERRLNADRAWLEYMPVDYPEEPALDTEPFPYNLRLYRDFRFGKHVHLVMTDLRRYRPPHLIAEDAFPGAVIADEPTLRATLGEVPTFAQPYVDLDSPAYAALAQTLQHASSSFGLPARRFSGKQDIAYLNTWIARYNLENPGTPLVELELSEATERGLAALHAGKTDLETSFGARYLVVAEAFEALAKVRYLQTAGASELVMGETQRSWFLETLRDSDATWRVWGNEYTFLRKTLDLSAFPVPDPRLKQRFLVSVEDWDGAPNERLALLSDLADVDGLAIVTGDIHSFFVGHAGLGDDASGPPKLANPPEFVCGAVSSATYQQLLGGLIEVEGVSDIAPAAAALLVLSNRHVSYSDLTSNGFAEVRARKDTFEVTFHALPSSAVAERDLSSPLSGHFSTQTFVSSKNGEVERRVHS